MKLTGNNSEATTNFALGHSRLGGASWRSSHVRNAPLATVGLKKAACPVAESAGGGRVRNTRLTWTPGSSGALGLPSDFPSMIEMTGPHQDAHHHGHAGAVND
jgi:hypothetical protein